MRTPDFRAPRRRPDTTDGEPNEALHVVLDDATIFRLRRAAVRSGVEVEQLIAHVIHLASWHLDDVLISEWEET